MAASTEESVMLPEVHLEAYPFPALVVLADIREDKRQASTESLPTGVPAVFHQTAVHIEWANGRWADFSHGPAPSHNVETIASERLRTWLAPDTPCSEVLLLDRPHVCEPLHLVKTAVDATTDHQTTLRYIIMAIPVRPSCTRLEPLDSNVAQPVVAEPDTEFQRSAAMPIHQLAINKKEVDPQAPAVTPATDCKLLLEQTDWAKTSLGPRDEWPPELHCMVRLIMASETQDSLWMGDDFTMIYNQHYCDIVNHPTVFGRSAKESWGPVWHSVYELIQRCLEMGEACYWEDDLLLYAKGPTGHFCEKYHSWSFIPIWSADGRVLGIYNPTIETTAAVLARRRQETMRKMSERTLVSRTRQDLYDGIAAVMVENPKDVPFLMYYSVTETDRACLALEVAVGVPEESVASSHTFPIPTRPGSRPLDARPASRIVRSDQSTSWPIAQALAMRQCVVINDCTALTHGFPLRQWDVLPESAIVIPLCQDGASDLPQAVIILGLNVSCPLDDDYADWIQMMRAHLSSALASVRAIEAEQDRIQEQQRLERAKQAWFQGAAHDLRSPLTLIAGPIDDVLATSLTPGQRQSLVLAQRNVTRIQRLVNSLLDFSRLEAGRLEGRFLPIDLGRFISDLASLFRPAVERRSIAYKVLIEPRDGVVFVDPTLLETVVTNLLSNALKYTDQGSISVSLTYDSRHAAIAIADTGFGIPSTEIGQVTDRYHRGTTAISQGTEGTGIGLALAKEIVRLHRGELLVQSVTAAESPDGSHGSTLTALIPLAERDVAVDNLRREVFGTYGRGLVDEAMHSDDESSVAPSMQAADGLLFEPSDVLLVVDDNNDMRAYIRSIFSPYCTVLEASDGEDAFRQAIDRPPHVILSDLMMRSMSGLDLLVAIRAHPSTRIVPMILHSAATDDELRLQALTSGAEDFLIKPFKPRELLARVHLHLQLGKRRAELEARFAARERELAILSDYCPSGILRADANGRITYGNKAWREYAGISANENLENWVKYVDEDTRVALSSRWSEIVYGDRLESSLTWRWVSGRIVQATFIRLDKAGPGMSGVLACLSDISYQEEKIQEAERRRQEAEESKRQQELLVDFTSHEIRTPVSAILQCSSLVKSNMMALRDRLRRGADHHVVLSVDDLDEWDSDIEALESIYQCGLVQERIANDVLSLARVQLDMLTFYDVDLDIETDARRVMSVFKAEAAMKKIELRLVMGDSISRMGITAIKTDHVRLGQVVTNLISNAMRFTAGSAVRHITLTYELATRPPQDGSCAVPAERDLSPVPIDKEIWLYVSVRDTGPGLSSEELTVLFQRFSQGSNMIHSRFGGSGLGLYICKMITELLDGRIEVQSRLGQGSEFRFFVKVRAGRASPVQPGAAPDSKPAEHVVPQSIAPVPNAKANAATQKFHILIVEDNDINRTVLKRQIQRLGWTCDEAVNGQEALDLYETSRIGHAAMPRVTYDIILMDLEMPVMDGLTAIRRIRAAEASADKSLQKQLVVALTGNARQEQVDLALQSGMDDVMIKPYRLPDLVDKVRAAVAASKIL